MRVPRILQNIPKSQVTFWMMLLTYFVVVIYMLHEYFIADTNIYMGLLLAPYILILRKGDISRRFLIPSILFIIVSFFIPVKSVLFLALLFGILFLIECCLGKLNNSFFILLLLLSPIFNYFNNSIGFPIRIWLSEMSGKILAFAGNNIKATGNFMIMGGNEFSVDSACAGLNMIMVSFIIALFILAYYQRKTHHEFSFHKVLFFLAITFILNIACNLIRIITLVYFKIMVENSMHEIIGIVCLGFYVIIPLVFISKYLFDRPPGKKMVVSTKNPRIKLNLILNAMILVTICYSGIRTNSMALNNSGNNYYIEGFKKLELKSGIIKFEKANALIYLKPVKFYSAEHNPMICWNGSGYEFKHINKEMINGHEIYTGLMTKGSDIIYTSWWFDNGKYKTISQLDWRFKVFQSEKDFCLVNVNSASRKELIIETINLLKKTSYKSTLANETVN
ncbi:MAG: exosortase N [Bacteroidetes bacterium]|nr:exosortase N [Bacteroidota bacterium]